MAKTGKHRTKGDMKSKVKYPQSVMRKVLSYIANGDSLDKLYESDPTIYPSPAKVGFMVESDPIFADHFYKAKKVLAHRLIEKLHHLQENPPSQTYFASDGKEHYLPKDLYKPQYDVWSKRLKSIQDEIHQLNSIYNIKYIKTQKIEGEIKQPQQVMIMDYKDWKKDSDLSDEDKPPTIN